MGTDRVSSPRIHRKDRTMRQFRWNGFTTVCVILYFAATAPFGWAATPTVEALLPGSWPGWARGGLINDVRFAGSYVYAALGQGGLSGFDVSDPTHIIEVGSCNTPGSSQGLAIAGNYAYLAEVSYGRPNQGLQIVDISNPAKCALLGRCSLPSHGW